MMSMLVEVHMAGRQLGFIEAQPAFQGAAISRPAADKRFTPGPALTPEQANAVRFEAAGLADMYAKAYPHDRAAFCALASDLRASRSSADVARSLLAHTGKAEMPTYSAIYDKMNLPAPPQPEPRSVLPSPSDVYARLNGAVA